MSLAEIVEPKEYAPSYLLSTFSTAALPLVVGAGAAPHVDVLCSWLRSSPEWVESTLLRHGAILFRGFDVTSPEAFEAIARSIDGELKNNYLGTSPRNALTDFVFSASELPGAYPIPQHCEMSFTKHPPRRLFFCCLRAPADGMGETPLVDFRTVYRELDPAVRERFENGGIRIIRNYAGPGGGGTFDLWKLKRWDEMFATTDRAEVEKQCQAEGFEPIWGPGQSLRLVSTQPVFRDHPISGERVWHNHTQVFHLSAAPGEYERIYDLRPTLRHWLLLQLSRVLVRVNRAWRSSDEQSMHCTYADGREIPDADMEHVRDVIWHNLVIIPWRRGDVVAIDNHSVAHGRLPYHGARQIAVCWA
ncbi:MAG: TauD/TfdA family dioxygenase [Deltaproteobacteria bacterium]|nr:TauD/TfdA family dioxygenase [Deltaproteobacteria bacterium]